MKITMQQAREWYRIGNNDGHGYSPYTDVAGEDTIDNALAAFAADGWEVILPRETSDDVALLRNGDGQLTALGGDAMGRNAWAVDVTRYMTAETL